MTDDLRALVERLKAVSHPLRLRVLALLAPGELGVCQVAETLQVPQSSVSEALRELRRAGFIVERKQGRWVFVSIEPKQELMPLLNGLLIEAEKLPKVQEDRARAKEVQALSLQSVCAKVQKVVSTNLEAARA
jgi:DNA-binding transcriptional ArsR family regulator